MVVSSVARSHLSNYVTLSNDLTRKVTQDRSNIKENISESRHCCLIQVVTMAGLTTVLRLTLEIGFDLEKS